MNVKPPRGVISSTVLEGDSGKGNDDLAFAKRLGFQPDDFEDLPTLDPKLLAESQPLPPLPNALPVSKPPKRMTAEEAEEKLRFDAMKAAPPSTGKVLTNISPDIMPAKFYVNRTGAAAQLEDIEDSGQKGARLDNLSGSLPYRNLPAFKHGIYLREPTVVDIAALSTALNSQSSTALFDTLGDFVNVPYRRLTNADHMQCLYYMLIKFYPIQRIPVTWDSSLYGVTTKSTAHEFYVTEHFFAMDPERWDAYEQQGFTLPRVYDLEAVEAASQIKDGLALLEIVQWLDPFHPVIAPYVKKAVERKSAHPRLQGRIDFLADKPARFKAEIDGFKEACGKYGISEELRLTAKVDSLTIGQALEHIYSYNNLSPEQEAEFTRLSKLTDLTPDELDITRKHEALAALEERTAEQEAEMAGLEGQLPNPYARTFEPVEEGVSLVRDLWRFFPLV